MAAGSGGSPNGHDGSSTANVIAAGFANNFDMAAGTYGQGGKFTSSSYAGQGGGSGGYNVQTVTVTPGSTITVTVGGGGAYSARRSSYATSGNAGFVKLAYGIGVE